jgi:FkbM family methyltransferase
MKLLKEINIRLLKWTERPIKLKNSRFQMPTERLGTMYGGWIIPTNYLQENSICYLVGAGTDISFDLEIAKIYNANIWIIDPTPKSVAHFEELKSNVFSGKKTPFAASETGFYEVEKKDFEKITFQQVGIWSENKTIRFFSPPDPTHVSHSIVNLHKTDTFFDAEVRKLNDLMAENKHKTIDLLKIDIEGAELEVIKSIVENKVSIGVICIEFDENARHHIDKNYISRIENAINSLENIGFRVFAKEKENNNFSMIHESVLEKING